MARPFTTDDAKKLISNHQNIMQRLGEAQASVQGYRTEIRAAADRYVAQETMRTLAEIPVEELNRDKQGFRVKTLRDSGYQTIADIVPATIPQLTAVNGISEDGAKTIKQVANELLDVAYQGVKLKLSVDNQTEEATALIKAISQYRQSIPVAEECSQLLGANSQNINKAIADVTDAINRFAWFVVPKDLKERATAGYSLLNGLMQYGYGQNTAAQLALMNEIKSCSAQKAWQDFTENSVGFFNILEEVAPGLLGNDDKMYGLPETLAQQIDEESYRLDGLKCELRRYQEWGVKYALHQKKALLGDEMGLGKTVQAIATMVALRNAGGTHFVVVCPASVITNWCREIEKMSDLDVIRVHGAGRDAALHSWLENGGVAVTTYETTGHFELAESFRFTCMVVDEAHYIKNPEAHRSINVRKMSGHAERLLFMTGTALENSVDEMISLIDALQPDIAVKLQGMASLSSAPQFREAVAPVYYRRKREDVLTELPELIENEEWCNLSRAEEEVYEQAVLSKNFSEARRVSWNVADITQSSKARRLLELVETARAEERKVIVFSFFLDTIRKISSLLADRCTSPITGSVSPQRRQEIIDEFDKAPAGTVLLAQIQSGGTGLNIQSASVVVLCEPQFKPSIENQAISRAYRMGQTRNVLVYRLLCDDTVDEKIMAVLKSKQAAFDAFADDSVVAAESEIDEAYFSSIIQEEIERINAKNGDSTVPEDTEPTDTATSEITAEE